MNPKSVVLLLIHLIPLWVQGQHVMGTVYEMDQNGKRTPLEGANVFFMGTNVGYTTGSDGMFHLNKPTPSADSLVISYVGVANDTVKAEGTDIEVTLSKAIQLGEVEVKGSTPDSYIFSLKTAKTEIITSAELKNNACCNLSESFETNPTVDVSFTDAVTGAKQIQMLGLAGKYAQLLTDVLPTIHGLGLAYGLNFIPGPWIESINLNKGAGSVANGYESISGQLDVELRKPEESEPLHLNLYGNTEQRIEANVYTAQKISSNWDHMFLAHGNMYQDELDHNHDHFLDLPKNKSLALMDRWKFNSLKRIESMFGVKYMYDDRWGGDTHFDPETDMFSTHAYGFALTTHRGEAFFKSSFNFPSIPYQSIGLQLSGIYHDQSGYYGLRAYDATEKSLYANLIFLSAFGDTKHKFKTGLSYFYNGFEEQFDTINQDRTESVPGAYFEYTFNDLDQWSVVLGLRGDYFSNYGFELIPRVHAKYSLSPLSTLRASAGRGVRIANVLSENMAYFASSRLFSVPDDLLPEAAWNYGLNFTQQFFAAMREGTFTIDVYRTDFSNQVIVDVDSDPQQVLFYNLNGKSYANTIQAELTYEVLKGLNAKVAYKYYDVQQTFNETLRQAPLTPRHRALGVLTYETPDEHWNFSFTTQWVGEQRLPDTSPNPVEYRMPATSPSYFRLLAQVSYAVKQWEFYAGSENITNFTQEYRIIAADEPFGPYFDSSIIWGPISDRMFYAGLRLTLLKK
jgi:outer membrane cobalamin receptor